jgi:hypothetical protein
MTRKWTVQPAHWSFYNLGEWQIRSAQLGHWVTKWRLTDPGLRRVRYVGRESLDGTSVDVVEWTYTIGYNRPEDDPVYTSRLAIGPDHFAHRIETTSTSKNEYEGRRIIETVSDIRTTPRTAKEEFAYRPPEGLQCRSVNPRTLYDRQVHRSSHRLRRRLHLKTRAVDSPVRVPRGTVVLMNYWGMVEGAVVWSCHSRAVLPRIQVKGFGLITVTSDPAADVLKMVEKRHHASDRQRHAGSRDRASTRSTTRTTGSTTLSGATAPSSRRSRSSGSRCRF